MVRMDLQPHRSFHSESYKTQVNASTLGIQPYLTPDEEVSYKKEAMGLSGLVKTPEVEENGASNKRSHK